MLRKVIKRKFDQVVYSSALINRILRNINRAFAGITRFRLRPYGVLEVRYGDVHFRMATNETSYVTKQLFWKGPGNFEYTPIFKKLIRRCNVFVDIGANTGYYSLLAAKTNPGVVVHAFEPASGPFHFLERNVELNNLRDRVRVHAVALSNRKGEVEFFEIVNPAGTYARHNLSGVGGLKKTHETQEQSVRRKVRAERLDEFRRSLPPGPIDLMKIDTEGTEDLVLEGAASTIREHKPIIICETLFNKIEAKLEAIMKAHGYLFFNHFDGKLHATATLVRASDNGVSDCFFVHPDKVNLIEEFLAVAP